MGLVTLDVRQESTRHSDAIDTVTQYLGLGSYKAWDEEQRLNFLIGELTGKRPLMPPGIYRCGVLQAAGAHIDVLDHRLCALCRTADVNGGG